MADYKVPKFLRKEGDTLFFNGDGELIFYVPEIYFERGDAIIKGEFINILGIFDYAIFDKNGKNSGLKRFYFPSVFLTKPSSIEKQKKVKLKANQAINDFRLLRYKKGDAVVVSVFVPQDKDNIEALYKIVLFGKTPTTIPYDKLHEYFEDNIALNGESYGISMQMFGFLISELCRDKNDLSKPFRITKDTDMTNYKAINLIDLPKYVSPHQSISSQNWDGAVVGAIVNDSNADSPLEKLLMG